MGEGLHLTVWGGLCREYPLKYILKTSNMLEMHLVHETLFIEHLLQP